MLQTQDLVKAGLYESEEAVIQDGLRYLLQARPEIRLELAVHRYQTEDISLGKAANLARVINNTVLSNFSLVDRLDILRELFGKLYVTYEVREEVLRGIQEGYAFLAEADVI